MTYRRWLAVAAAVFFGSLIIGLVLPVDIQLEDMTGFNDLAGMFEDIPPAALFLFILTRNASVMLLSFVFAPAFLLGPVFIMAFNGVVIGLISTAVIEQESLGFLLSGLLPHGVLEIPALLIGWAAALSFGFAAARAMFRKETRPQLMPVLRKNLRYLVIALLLLIPAALIETFVTPLILD